ncbi:MAG: EthD domain-containing protein [Proteobacteria bacterium]|nr:EthD domain-containing protein [Pseudomonadota bacterium]HQR03607.1 EthD domain-containing protein [Rhodocyclaceae bacterium]
MQMKYKMIYLARRNPGLAAEDFPRAWREHSALGRQCPNVGARVLGVAQCARILDAALPGLSTDYDGVNLMQLRDLESAHAIWSDPDVVSVMKPDELRVFDGHVAGFTLVTTERVLREGPAPAIGAVALISFLARRPGMHPDEFAAAWAAQTAAAVADDSLPGVQSVVHNLTALPPPAGYAFDGIAEWWFASREAAAAALTGGMREALLGEGLAPFCDSARNVHVMTRVTHGR